MDTVFRRILVPLDGSDIADSAISVAKIIGRLFDSEICLLTVLDEQVETSAPYGNDSSRADLDSGFTTSEFIPERACKYLEDVSDDLAASDLRSTFKFSTNDDIASEITLTARDIQADLVVMATRGRSGVAIGLLSPITDRVIHSSSIPVLIVSRSQELWNPRTLIVPLDGSDMAEQVLPYVESISRKTDASIALIRVVTSPRRYGRDPYGGVPTDLLITDQQERDAEAYLAVVSTRLNASGRQVESHVVKGHAGAQVTRLARDIPEALVVINTRGASGLTRWVLGCTADNVIRSSGVPVLIIPPEMNW